MTRAWWVDPTALPSGSASRCAHAALVVLAACAHAPPAKLLTLADAPAIATAEVEQLAELGDALYLFAPRQIEIVRAGVIVANVPADVAHWVSAATIPALDGEGRWVVATDAQLHLFRVRATGELEPIRDQLGVGAVTTIASAGSTLALLTNDGLAVSSDGLHLARYPVPGLVAVAQGRIAVATAQAVELWDLAHGTRTSFPIAHARPAFLDAEHAPRLVVATPAALFVEEAGNLARIATPPEPLAIVAGAKLWVTAGGALYSFDGAGLVRTATLVPRAARVFGGHDGAVWIAADRQLASHALEQRVDDPRWRADVAPVFQRVCAHCHLPGGSADLDLSTVAAWQAERGEIKRRVLITRTMPPAGTDLSEADRAALARWLD